MSLVDEERSEANLLQHLFTLYTFVGVDMFAGLRFPLGFAVNNSRHTSVRILSPKGLIF